MLCPKCGMDAELPAWLDKVTSVSGRKKWFWSRCPACDAASELKVNRGNVELGAVDGFPGPAFIPYKTYPTPGLSVRWDEKCVHVLHEGRTWSFRTK
jgi:hypothetical protein